MAKKLRSNHHLRRIDVGNTHGWQFVAMWNGKSLTKLFSDKVHGGKRKALQAAKEHRDEVFAVRGIPENNAPIERKSYSTKNLPQYPGITIESYTKKDGSKTRWYCSTYRPAKNVNRIMKRFNINKLGEEVALKKAINWRKRKLRERRKAEK